MRIELSRRTLNRGDTRRWVIDGPDGSVSWALLASPRPDGEDTPGAVEIHSPRPQWVDHIIATQCPVMPKCYANSVHVAGHKLCLAWKAAGSDDEVIWSELAKWYRTHLLRGAR